MSEWRTIDSAPKDYSDVLLYDPEDEGDNSGVLLGWFDVEKRQWYSHEINTPARISPTHWQPLPGPPHA